MAILSNTALANPSRGYDIEQSLRFNDDDSPYLSATQKSGTTTTWTFSSWVKRCELSAQNPIFTVGANNTNDFLLYFVQPSDDDEIDIIVRTSSTIHGRLRTTQVFRDTSAWYHIVFVYDSTNATSSERMRLYINGERVTAFNTETYPSQNQVSIVNNSSYTMYLGQLRGSADSNFDGYLAEVNLIDGQALTPASFGKTHSSTNQWIPKQVTGLTYGTNGFYEKFSATELSASFADSATYHNIHTVTAAGNTHTDTTIKKFGTASGQWDGSGDYLSVPDSIDWCFDDGDWTVDFWLYHTAHPSTDHFDFIISQPNSTSPSGQSYIGTRRDGSGTYYLMGNHSGESNQSNAFSISLDTWTHFAICKDGNQMYFYKDGVSVNGVGNGVTTTVTWPNYNVPLRIGYQQDVEYYNGYADEIRISKGIARYPSGTSFSVATSEYAADKYDVLLLHCNGSDSGTTFTDSSWVGLGGPARHYITANGNITNSRAQSKFSSSAVYSSTTSEFLSTSPHILLPQEFTWEGWVRFENATPGETSFFNLWDGASIGGHDNRSYRIWFQNGSPSKIGFAVSSDGDNPNSNEIFWNWTPSQNTWYYISVGRDSSNDCRAFIDGSAIGTTQALTRTAFTPNIAATENYLGGSNGVWYQDVQFSTTNRYTSTYSVPTESVTADSNTVFLVNSDFNGGLGADSSGNKNDFDITNITVSDQVLDSPTNNFCTLNSVGSFRNPDSGGTLSEGNLKLFTGTGTGAYTDSYGTFSFSSGKWYFEAVIVDKSAGMYFGITDPSVIGKANSIYPQNQVSTIAWNPTESSGYIRIDNSDTAYSANTSAGAILGIAIDMDNDTIRGSINGTNYANVDISGSAVGSGVRVPFFCAFGQSGGDTGSQIINFGQDSSFAGQKTAQGNQDGNKKGDFYYAPPSGFLALCTDNLPDPTIADPTAHFITNIWTGSGADNRTITTGFDPGLSWIKRRNGTNWHSLSDSVRAANPMPVLYSNDTSAEATDANALAFVSNGYTVDDNNYYNASAGTYVGWTWKGSDTPSKTYAVTVTNPGSGNRYTLDTRVSGTNAIPITLEEGGTYTFDQAAASNSGHPLRFSTTANGTHGGGSEYTTGVTTNGTPGNSGAYTRITVAASAPTLYYYCTAHSGMGAQASTPGSGGGVSDLSGTIASVVNANTTAGFSIVSWTASGTNNDTVGHGLSVVPELIIMKSRDGVRDWYAYTQEIDGSLDFFLLNGSNAKQDSGANVPTSSVFSVIGSTVNVSGEKMIGYCFHSVDGYIKVGSYEGNANVNGPFVYTGFKPAMVIAKCADAVSSWDIVDNKRDPDNGVIQRLFPNNTSADDVSAGVMVDFLSNGFKVRTTSGNWNNGTSDTQFYIAFAETPFSTANAR